MLAPTAACLLAFAGSQEPVEVVAAQDSASFRLGAATASAQRTIVDGEVQIVVRVRNGTAHPLWWPGAGEGCVRFGFQDPPFFEDGSRAEEFCGEWIGCQAGTAPTEDLFTAWRLAPGDERVVPLRPFWPMVRADAGADRGAIPLRLVRWAFYHEFTLPLTAPPEGRLEPRTLLILFAWDHALGMRVFVDGEEGDIWLPHFDPFDATPFLRDDPTPVWLGPLHGTVRLHGESGEALELDLRNDTTQSIHWRVRPEDSPTCFAPGERRAILVRGLVEDLDPELELPAPRERWHAVLDSTWPAQGDPDGVAPPRANLHVVGDPRYGLAVNLTRPRREFLAFEASDTMCRYSAALRIGDRWIVAEALWGADARCRAVNEYLREGESWLLDSSELDATESFRWLDGPPLDPSPIEEGQVRAALAAASSAPVRPSARILKVGYSDLMPVLRDDEAMFDSATWRVPASRREWSPGWEWSRMVLVRGAASAEPSSRIEAVRVRWSPEAGLELTKEPALSSVTPH